MMHFHQRCLRLTAHTDLFFELSNDDRVKLIYTLSDGPGKLTELSKSVGITHQQCLRHLKRLIDIGLIKRNEDGQYGITTYGLLTLKFIPSLKFVSDNREYWENHLPFSLPPELVSRL